MEPQVIEEESDGAFDEAMRFDKGPVNVTVYYDREATDPREWTGATTAELEAYEEGEVFTFWINYHDGEGDMSGTVYGRDNARREALEALDEAWNRYQDEK